MGKILLPMKNNLEIKKKESTELCEVHIKGTPEMILKIFGVGSDSKEAPKYCN